MIFISGISQSMIKVPSVEFFIICQILMKKGYLACFRTSDNLKSRKALHAFACFQFGFVATLHSK